MAFDRAALTYDRDFTEGQIARWLRERTWERLDVLFQPGMRVLEIGCGTGEDALHLARRGVNVTATDASAKMLDITRQKAAAVGVGVTCHPFDLNDAATWQRINGTFDGVYSNFGALNCTRNWSALAEWLAGRLPPSGTAAFGVMGRFCLWETLWHGFHLDWRTARRRWSGAGQATLADGSTFAIFYPSARDSISCFQAVGFQKKDLLGLGVFLPPSDIYPVIEKRPWLLNALIALENRLAHHFPGLGDHFWLEMERR